MKIDQFPTGTIRREIKFRAAHRQQQAVALIIVLAMLVLLSGLIVSFMSTVGNERSASIANSASSSTRQIADSTVNLVMAQIREATSQSGNGTTWASQPGAVRTFSGKIDGGTVNTGRGAYDYIYTPGGNDAVYKLYSSEQMKVSSADYAKDLAPGNANNEVGVIEQWDRTKPRANFVDLNEPILSPRADLTSGTSQVVEPRYPIIDPRAKFDQNENPSGAPNFGIVEGFDIKSPSNPNFLDPKLKTPANKGVPYLPMPVKWLYVLRDGSMAAADDGGKIKGATAENPIVGRTGFWTDDESCKLNINTASEGVFWDTPSVSAEKESGQINTDKTVGGSQGFSLASSQPAQGEYQRYPGHPATTCLSPVLGWMWNVTPLTSTRPTVSAQYQQYKEAIYSMIPFLPVGKGTSAGAGTGTAAAGTNFPGGVAYPGGTDNPDRVSTQASPTAPVVQYKPAVASKYLYATVDDLLFKRDPRNLNASSRLLNSFTNTTLGAYGSATLEAKLPQALEKVRFLLTANSRSPELNLFGRPRVTIWPVNASQKLRTAADNLFAFASTIGGGYNSPNTKPYYFTRAEAKSDVIDYNLTVSGRRRNQELIRYLKGVTGDDVGAIPGFGKSFATKYNGTTTGSAATERDQILTEIFDYVRAVNLVDTGTSRGSVNSYQPYTPFYGTGLAGYGGISQRSYDWSGQVTPISIDQTKGMGRFFTVSEAALMFHRIGVTSGNALQPEMQAVLILEMTTPMPGFPGIRETYWTRIRENTVTNGVRTPPNITVKDRIKPFNLARDWQINIPNMSSHEILDGRSFMPTLGCGTAFFYFPEHNGPTNPLLNPNDSNRNPSATVALKTFLNKDPANAGLPANATYARGVTVKNYPYVSDRFLLDVSPTDKATTFILDRTTFEVEIYSGESPNDKFPDGSSRSVLVQTIKFTFPTVTLPVPEGAGAADVSLATRFPGALTSKDANPDFIRAYDVVRSVEMVGGKGTQASLGGRQQGDIRLAMVKREVPESFFLPRGDNLNPKPYFSTTKLVHGLQYAHGNAMTGYFPTPGNETSSSTLAQGGTNRSYGATDNKLAILPPGIFGVQRSDGGPGDYDRGLSKHLDGAVRKQS